MKRSLYDKVLRLPARGALGDPGPTPVSGRTTHLYVDDSGVRFADRPSTPRHDGLDYFAMGGLLVGSEHAPDMEAQLDELCKRHQIFAPLHSSSMRSQKKEWAWLGVDQPRASRWMHDLTDFLCSLNGHATACIVHRPGYEARYGHYRDQRWQLCKSAYTILVERAAKFAQRDGRRLAVYVEETGTREDRAIRAYHQALRAGGMIFNPQTSSKYMPLPAAAFADTLFKNVRFFRKNHPLGQLADLLLYPLVKGGYDPSYRPYRQLVEAARVIDCALPDDERPMLGVKYFCFDGLQKAKGPGIA